jgi:hypothetical protein
MQSLQLFTIEGREMRWMTALALSAAMGSAIAAPKQAPLAPEVDAMLARVTANSLRGHLSFIASDLLEGRGSPSRGLDLAAEYIAAQYRRAGLEPIGDDGYFQTANWQFTEADLNGFKLVLHNGAEQLALSPFDVSFKPGRAVAGSKATVVKVDFKDMALDAVKAKLAGAIVLTEFPATKPTSAKEFAELMKARADFVERVAPFKPLAVLALMRAAPAGNAGGNGDLVDPSQPSKNKEAALQTLTLHGAAAIKFHDSLAMGASTAMAEVNLPAAVTRAVKLRNVAGVLRGSDPSLKETYVMLTAHYDHLGMRDTATGKVIYNGANDDGSGTVSVIEIASTIAAMKQRPKRSILFLTVFGEERGLLGSRFYGRNPLVPFAKTVADVNLEQLGRTDDDEGAQIGRAGMTGFDFSDMGAIFASAGTHTGVELFKHPVNSDKYFAHSDNQALADQGVPAHTISVAYGFPDYHGLGDKWHKVDYDNMAKVDRMVALGLWNLANDPKAPQWNANNKLAAPYLEAQKKQ